MPRVRKKASRRRPDPARLTWSWQVSLLLSGPVHGATQLGFDSEEDLLAAWQAHEETILSAWVKHYPCSRPRCWWLARDLDQPAWDREAEELHTLGVLTRAERAAQARGELPHPTNSPDSLRPVQDELEPLLLAEED